MNFGKCLAHKTCLNPATVSLKFQIFVLEINFPKGGNRFPELKKFIMASGNWFPGKGESISWTKNWIFPIGNRFPEWGNWFPELIFWKNA